MGGWMPPPIGRNRRGVGCSVRFIGCLRGLMCRMNKVCSILHPWVWNGGIYTQRIYIVRGSLKNLWSGFGGFAVATGGNGWHIWAKPFCGLGASTHKGEEAVVLSAQVGLKNRALLLAPRTPHRAEEVYYIRDWAGAIRVFDKGWVAAERAV